MINNIIIVLLAILKIIGIWGGLILIILPMLLLIQLISYQGFKFNIYKKLINLLSK